MHAAVARESLVPLDRAVELIADAVYRAGTRPLPDLALFDGLANTVSALVPMFVVDGGGAQQLSEAELDRALFRKGGAEMYFADGRAPVVNLAVTSDAIAQVVRILKGSATD